MRLFAAIRPPVQVLDHLERALSGVAALADAGGVRWAAQENLHLTLAFFGEVPDGAVGELAEELADVAGATSSFAMRLRGAGVFGQRTVWVGAGGEVESFVGLAARARAAGEGLSRFRDERARQRPHLTIGRVGPARAGRDRRAATLPVEVEHLVHALSVYEGPSWTVSEIALESSVPGAGRGGGPRYETVHRMPLAAVAG